MTIDEGYVKYISHWTPGPPPDVGTAQLLDRWRQPLFEAELIGQYDDIGVGYGNISTRCGEPPQFLISGTQTGHLAVTDEQHYALVTDYDLDRNTVNCTGPIQASSEAMTHAAIYELRPDIHAIVHVHSKTLWKKYLGQLPTTDPGIAYGTPDMAQEFVRLYTQTRFGETGLAVMAGHEDGLVSIGSSLEQAAERLLNLFRQQARA